MTESSISWMLDFDPNEGPLPYESQDEFYQRIDIRGRLWGLLEMVITHHLRSDQMGYLMDFTKGFNRQRMTWLLNWKLVVRELEFKNTYTCRPSDEGMAFYFSEREWRD